MSSCKDRIVESLTELSHNERIMIPFALLGVLTLGSFTWKALAGITKYFVLPRKNLFSRYGKGWAIVTGASDGLGKQYAFELAKENFHIILVGRDEAKLKFVAS